MITVIDVNIGNVNSVSKALNYLKVDHKVTNNLDDILEADKIIFPGVGSFYEASKRIKASGIIDALKKRVLEDKFPF